MYSDIETVNERFESFEELRDAVRGWDLDFRQTGAGSTGHQLVQLAGKDFGFAYNIFNSPYDQRSAAPKGLRTFSVLAELRAPSTWCGHHFGDNTLVAMPFSDEFRALSSGYFSNYIISLPESVLAVVADRQYGVDWDTLVPGRSEATFEINGIDMRMLRQALRKLALLVATGTQSIDYSRVVSELSALIIECLLSSSPVNEPKLVRNRQKYFRKAQDFIDANILSSITMLDICAAADIGERALELAFKEQFSITPKAYLNSQRLARVRQRLSTGNGRERITDIATEFGFWHMGQFAKDYRKIYGENPSQTRDLCFRKGLNG